MDGSSYFQSRDPEAVNLYTYNPNAQGYPEKRHVSGIPTDMFLVNHNDVPCAQYDRSAVDLIRSVESPVDVSADGNFLYPIAGVATDDHVTSGRQSRGFVCDRNKKSSTRIPQGPHS